MSLQSPDPAGRTFDAIVVGSGASGGWAAKRLAEAGLQVALLEAGRPWTEEDNREHVPPYDRRWRGRTKEPLARLRPQQSRSYACDEWNADWYANDLEEPYTTPDDLPFPWVGRMRIVGGRTNVWGRQSYRFSDADFKAASHDGEGLDWPIGYADLAPYYDIVEGYVGIQGRPEGHPLIPDGRFQPPMAMTCAEVALRDRVKARLGRTVTIARSANLTAPLNGRAPCHYCGPCERGCLTRSYFNAAFTTVPDAVATGRCTVVTGAMAYRVLMDPDRHRARGVLYVDRATRQPKEIFGRAVLLCAQAFESTRILFNSHTRQDPNGLGNASGLLGRYLTVHFTDAGASAQFPEFGGTPSLGGPRRPSGIFVARFRNVPGGPRHPRFLRGYGYQGGSGVGFSMGARGFGEDYKRAVREGGTSVSLQGFGESLPHADNRVEIDPRVVDAYGIPALRIHMALRDNDRAMLRDMAESAAEMLEAAGGRNISTRNSPRWASHEVGCARMGRDPKTSVVDEFQQVHDVANLFVMDGASFTSGGWSNPTLTIMALAVRSCDRLLERFRQGSL